jgi:hypothetical protein
MNKEYKSQRELERAGWINLPFDKVYKLSSVIGRDNIPADAYSDFPTLLIETTPKYRVWKWCRQYLNDIPEMCFAWARDDANRRAFIRFSTDEDAVLFRLKWL